MKSLRLLNFLVFLLVVDVVIDPGNLILGIKEFLFVSIFILWLASKQIKIDVEIFYVILFVALILPVYGFLIGIIRQENFIVKESLQYLKGFVFFALLFVTISKKIDISKYLVYSGFFIVLITIWLYIDIGEYSFRESYYFVEKNAARISRRTFANILFDPVVFYNTSPILLFPLAYYLDRCEKRFTLWNTLAAVLFLAALFISATRANMLSALILIVIFLYNVIRNKWRIVLYILIPLSIILSMIFLPHFFKTYIFDPLESSNSIKIDHFKSYIELFKNDLSSLIFGQGMGAGFYSYAKEALVYKTELTYMELIRMFGIVMTSVFIIVLFIPIYIFSRNTQNILFSRYKYVYKAYFLYLILEIGSNPLLIGSTGMIVLVSVFSSTFFINKSIQIEST